MIILDYNKKNHKIIIHAAVEALKQGKIVAYPTDTSYGLAVDATNLEAVRKLYRLKGREFKKPIHVVAPSVAYAKSVAVWNKISTAVIKAFWPGAVTLVLPLNFPVNARRGQSGKNACLGVLSANTGYIGLRQPDHAVALDLAKKLGAPITATSANVSGRPDCYSAEQIREQYKDQRHKPDLVINYGKLKVRKPSTLVKITAEREMEILRVGPISEKQIKSKINTKRN